MFAAWGRFIYRFRWAVLAISAVLLGASIVGVLQGGELKSGGPTSSNLDAARAQKLVTDQITSRNNGGATTGSSMLLLMTSSTLTAADPAFASATLDAVAPLRADSRVVSVTTPFEPGEPPQQAAALTSQDRHTVLVSVQLKDTPSVAGKYLSQLESEVHSPSLKIVFTGNVPINQAFNKTLESDLTRAEYVSLPVSLVLLLIIFAAVVAAALPLAVGILAIVGALAATFLLARVTDVSQYALNIVTLIGLGVAIDYSLFVVNRYRDELAAGASREEALAITMATAGRAITFSGITVAVGLSAMLFYQGTFLASMGAAGAIVVFIAVFYGLTFLPALLAVLGPHVDRLHLGALMPRPLRGGGGFWRWIARGVMRRPVLVLVPALAVLIAAGIPFTQLRLANGDVDMLPPHLAARQGYDQLLRDFPSQQPNYFQVVVQYPSGGDPLSPSRASDISDLSHRIASVKGVTAVQSPDKGTNIVELSVATNQPPSSDAARATLRTLRAMQVPDATLLVGGQTAYDVDVIDFIAGRTPIAVAFVMLVTYLVLFLLTGSLVLPVKALVMNLLSISASFGALVFIFQQGHFASLLQFTPQSIDPTIPVILFSIVFGLSMDYEVLLVSRIHEEYQRSGDNRQAVAEGLQRSGRLITGAAAIMVAVFLAFGLAEVVLIKAIGIGLAIAVALDSTIVRALVVPAVMRLLGDLNWWAPRSLRRLYERAGIGEIQLARPEAA